MPKKMKQEQGELAAGEADVPSRRKSSSAALKRSTARKSSPKRKTGAALPAVVEPSDDEIRLRAYFISERRRRFDLAGDASSDWLEAKRQLLSEAGRR
jgi:hypothetical protein